jgi:hypothetical protein
MKKQTALEWYHTKLAEPTTQAKDVNTIFLLAKAMEKENSEISFFAGYNYEGGYPIDEHEQYYTETFTEK